MTHIKIIAGSTRPGRFNMQPAVWIHALAQQRTDCKATLVNLAELELPLLDESVPASQHQYEHAHTKMWSAVVEEADGFVFVTPEYNHSMSAALKNALDYLYDEWNYKPVSFVSYGSLAGGARAVEHLRGVAGELRMYDLREHLLLPSYWDHLDENGQYQFTDTQESKASEMLDALVFWAEHMKSARRLL